MILCLSHKNPPYVWLNQLCNRGSPKKYWYKYLSRPSEKSCCARNIKNVTRTSVQFYAQYTHVHFSSNFRLFIEEAADTKFCPQFISPPHQGGGAESNWLTEGGGRDAPQNREGDWFGGGEKTGGERNTGRLQNLVVLCSVPPHSSDGQHES